MKRGCLLIVSEDGLYWTGREWSADRHQAQQFHRLLSPFRAAQAVASALRSGSRPCRVTYESQRLPGPHRRRRVSR